VHAATLDSTHFQEERRRLVTIAETGEKIELQKLNGHVRRLNGARKETHDEIHNKARAARFLSTTSWQDIRIT
jgi:hypothetical protein